MKILTAGPSRNTNPPVPKRERRCNKLRLRHSPASGEYVLRERILQKHHINVGQWAHPRRFEPTSLRLGCRSWWTRRRISATRDRPRWRLHSNSNPWWKRSLAPCGRLRRSVAHHRLQNKMAGTKRQKSARGMAVELAMAHWEINNPANQRARSQKRAREVPHPEQQYKNHDTILRSSVSCTK
jgi:hypothetical protein